MAKNLNEIYELLEGIQVSNKYDEEIKRLDKKYGRNSETDKEAERILFCDARYKVTIDFIKSRKFSITKKFLRLLIEINSDMDLYFRDTDLSTNRRFITTAINVVGSSQVDADFLDSVPLKNHTLNVAREMIRISENSPVQTACCNLAIALAHDFGKSPILRTRLERRVEELRNIKVGFTLEKDESQLKSSDVEEKIIKKNTEDEKKSGKSLTKGMPHHYYSALYLRDKAIDCGLSDLSELFFEVILKHHDVDLRLVSPSIVPFIVTLKEADEGARLKELSEGRRKAYERERQNNNN